jgi:Rha family phage regulatory protein
MEEIIKKETMTSLEIAEVTGKQHAHIMRDIRKLLEQGVSESNFGLTSYQQAQPNGGTKDVPMYQLTKKGCLILASGYDALLREKIINRWEELEIKEREQYQVPQSFAEALMLAAKQQQQIEEQQKQLEANSKEIVELNGAIAEMKPKVTYVDMILASKETVATTQIAQDYGYSAKAFNVLLRNFGIHHKVGGQWILYAKFLPYGYVQSDTIAITHRNGSAGSVMHTKWTQKGRLFLYDELKEHDVFPLIERKQED